MGEVLAAYGAQIGRELAIKRLHDDRPSFVQLARFLREARIQRRLQHPAIPIAALCMFVVLLFGTAASLAHAVSSAHYRAREQLQIKPGG
jgi:serine/threonine protein kinase